jgi:hypothetical protein
MIPRSCVIRVRPAPAISAVRILPIRAGPGWRGGWGGWDGRRGAEPPADGRGRVLVVPGRAPLGRALTLCSRASGDNAASRPPLRPRPAGTRRRGDARR